MIITTVRHGRTKRDTKNLLAHLRKEIGQTSRVVKIGNVALSNADDAAAYMEMMRDGSFADVAMHHIAISPVVRMSPEQIDDAVGRILVALGAEDHPYVLFEHDGKARSAKAADQHFHVMLGHVGPDGKALDDSGSFRKLEAVARSIEADIGEDLTHSRRTAAVAAELRAMGRDDVADALQAPAELPRAAMSSTTRAVAARAGIDLPETQAAVRAAWTAADNAAAFRSALAEQGLEVRPGKKAGVFVVAAGDVEIGALDRIVRKKRGEVAARMEVQHVHQGETPAVSLEGGNRDLQIDADDARRREEAPPVARAAGGERPGGRPARRDQGNPGGHSAGPEARADGDRRPRQEGRRPRRKAQDAVAVRKLAAVGKDERLTALAADIRERTRPAIERVSADLDRRLAATDLGIADPFIAPAPDDALRRSRRLLAEAEQAVKSAITDWAGPRRIAEKTAALDMPRGMWAWLSGKQATWRRDVAAAEAELSRIRDLITAKRDAAQSFVRPNDRLEKLHRSEIEEAQRRHYGRRHRLEADRRLLMAAHAVLAENPALARRGLQAVLRAAQERLEAERLRQEQEALRRRQEARWSVPADEPTHRPGPRM